MENSVSAKDHSRGRDKVIVFATGNENKMKEIRSIMSGLHVTIRSLRQLGLTSEAEENGSTFAENAEIKAMEIYEKIRDDEALRNKFEGCEVITMADDSGLCVDALDGAPGIYSARWLGHDTPYEEKNRVLLEKLADVPPEKRGAAFKCAICAVRDDGTVLHTEAEMRGIIADRPCGENGFGYDPIFYLPQLGKTSSELSPEEKNKISHRGKALELMKEKLASEFTHE